MKKKKRESWDRFPLNMLLENFAKIIDWSQFLIISDSCSDHFIWRRACISNRILSYFSSIYIAEGCFTQTLSFSRTIFSAYMVLNLAQKQNHSCNLITWWGTLWKETLKEMVWETRNEGGTCRSDEVSVSETTFILCLFCSFVHSLLYFIVCGLLVWTSYGHEGKACMSNIRVVEMWWPTLFERMGSEVRHHCHRNYPE
jgi:hypothetical protein